MTKTSNLKSWRASSEMREQLAAFEANMNTLCQENESLREDLEAQREEIINDLREELREEYDEKLADLIRQSERKDRRIAELEATMNDCIEEYERQIHDYEVAIMALRKVMACTVNNYDGPIGQQIGYVDKVVKTDGED